MNPLFSEFIKFIVVINSDSYPVSMNKSCRENSWRSRTLRYGESTMDMGSYGSGNLKLRTGLIVGEDIIEINKSHVELTGGMLNYRQETGHWEVMWSFWNPNSICSFGLKRKQILEELIMLSVFVEDIYPSERSSGEFFSIFFSSKFTVKPYSVTDGPTTACDLRRLPKRAAQTSLLLSRGYMVWTLARFEPWFELCIWPRLNRQLTASDPLDCKNLEYYSSNRILIKVRDIDPCSK